MKKPFKLRIKWLKVIFVIVCMSYVLYNIATQLFTTNSRAGNDQLQRRQEKPGMHTSKSIRDLNPDRKTKQQSTPTLLDQGIAKRRGDSQRIHQPQIFLPTKRIPYTSSLVRKFAHYSLSTESYQFLNDHSFNRNDKIAHPNHHLLLRYRQCLLNQLIERPIKLFITLSIHLRACSKDASIITNNNNTETFGGKWISVKNRDEEKLVILPRREAEFIRERLEIEAELDRNDTNNNSSHNNSEAKLLLLNVNDPEPIGLEEACTLLSVGIGKDISAEIRFRNLLPQCMFYGIDPTRQNGKVYQLIGQYFQFAVGAVTKESAKMSVRQPNGAYVFENIPTLSFGDFISKHLAPGIHRDILTALSGKENMEVVKINSARNNTVRIATPLKNASILNSISYKVKKTIEIPRSTTTAGGPNLGEVVDWFRREKLTIDHLWLDCEGPEFGIMENFFLHTKFLHTMNETDFGGNRRIGRSRRRKRFAARPFSKVTDRKQPNSYGKRFQPSFPGDSSEESAKTTKPTFTFWKDSVRSAPAMNDFSNFGPLNENINIQSLADICQINVEFHGMPKWYRYSMARFDYLIWSLIAQGEFLPLSAERVSPHLRVFLFNFGSRKCVDKYLWPFPP